MTATLGSASIALAFLQEEALDAAPMAKQGTTVEQIKAEIDAKYGKAS